MKLSVLTKENVDDIQGVTLEERAKLVLLTLGQTADDIKKAYRSMAKRYHPDKTGGDTERFQVVQEAYELLTKGVVSKNPLLANTKLIVKLVGKRIKPLIDKQKEWEKYEQWRREHFYGIGAL
ncbi:MAG: J domain-containing protein [Lentisphaerae bacterium]|nr:J domain-containing protein [Lentisphaerota bacterium]